MTIYTIGRIILEIVWLGRIIHNVISYTHLWYVKEHRLDRIWIHITKTSQGKWILFPRTKIPPKSPKTIFLVVGAMCIFSIIGYELMVLHVSSLIILLIIDIGTFPVFVVLETILMIPTAVLHTWYISRAEKLLKSKKFEHVIGITGSYGKTSTKAFLSTLVSVSYNPLLSSGSINSPIGIAEMLLSNNLSAYDVLIAEMGAYKKGEIAKMTEMVKPQIAILTAINAQHQDLFGSIEITKEAKYELIQGISQTGTVIVNADTEHSNNLAKRAKNEGKTVWLYTSTNNAYTWADEVFRIDTPKMDNKSIAFAVVNNNKRHEYMAPVLGIHHAHNLTASIMACRAIGMSWTDIERGMHKITVFPKTMEKVAGINGSVFINDTFNNNPDAAKAAIFYLSTVEKKKILVFQPMIELGKYSESSHRDVGAYAGKLCDQIILTNQNFNVPFMEGVRSVNKDMDCRVMDTHSAANAIATAVIKGDCVIFKGREAELVLLELQQRMKKRHDIT